MVLSKKPIAKALIRLHGCAGWSAPVLFANPWRQVFSRRGPNVNNNRDGQAIIASANWHFRRVRHVSNMPSCVACHLLVLFWRKGQILERKNGSFIRPALYRTSLYKPPSSKDIPVYFHNKEYSITCLERSPPKRPIIGFQDRLSLNASQKYCRMLQESILQYFRPALSYHLSLRPLFCLFLSGRSRQVLLY